MYTSKPTAAAFRGRTLVCYACCLCPGLKNSVFFIFFRFFRFFPFLSFFSGFFGFFIFDRFLFLRVFVFSLFLFLSFFNEKNVSKSLPTTSFWFHVDTSYHFGDKRLLAVALWCDPAFGSWGPWVKSKKVKKN